MHFLRYKYLMTPNQLLKNALSVLTLYRGIVPADQFNKSVQPVINDIRNYLADQILQDLKPRTVPMDVKSTGFGLLDDALKEFKK
jgi:hypothetical protein